MRKQTKKILTLITLFLVVLFTISCNKDNTKSEGIGKYTGEWFASEIIMDGDVVDKYTIDENTKSHFIINLDGSITITYSGEIIKDISQNSDKSYNFIDGEGNEFFLEFESDVRCLQITPSEEASIYATVLIKRQ